MFTNKITLFSKLNRLDSRSGKDEWFKYEIDKCVYNAQVLKSATDKSINVGTTFTVLIPFRNYLPYEDWKLISIEDKKNWYTLKVGDIIVLKDISIQFPNITLSEVRKSYPTLSFEVRSVEEVQNRGINRYQFRVTGV